MPARYFYPRTPCGVRQPVLRFDLHVLIFLSTYPVRGTTAPHPVILSASGISIHVPRAGYDEASGAEVSQENNFYPRTPCGVRPVTVNFHFQA